jgi:hypothetical protein
MIIADEIIPIHHDETILIKFIVAADTYIMHD